MGWVYENVEWWKCGENFGNEGMIKWEWWIFEEKDGENVGDEVLMWLKLWCDVMRQEWWVCGENDGDALRMMGMWWE